MLTKPGDLGPKYEAGEIELTIPHLLCSLTSASQKKPISTYLLISNYNFKKKQGILLNRRETLKCVRINPTCVRSWTGTPTLSQPARFHPFPFRLDAGVVWMLAWSG